MYKRQAAYRPLRSDILGHKLEHGAGIIVQSADDAGIDFVLDARERKTLLQIFEVLPAFGAEIVQNDGRILVDGAAAFFFAVEKPERILFKTGLTIAAKLVKACLLYTSLFRFSFSALHRFSSVCLSSLFFLLSPFLKFPLPPTPLVFFRGSSLLFFPFFPFSPHPFALFKNFRQKKKFFQKFS